MCLRPRSDVWSLISTLGLSVVVMQSGCSAELPAPWVDTSLAGALSLTLNSCDASELISAMTQANQAGAGPHKISLAVGCGYSLTQPDNWWYGPTGLPAIASDITIEGGGATIARSAAAGTPKFRLFYVAGAPTDSALLPAGKLTLRNLSLQGGVAQGGSGASVGGGGAGLGGAIFNQGELVLSGVLVSGNQALGGSGGAGGVGGGGGGMGGDGASGNGGGGGFRGSGTPDGGGFVSGEGGRASGAGGSGTGMSGQNSTLNTGGAGGGSLGLGGRGGGNLGQGQGGNGLAGDGGGGGGNIVGGAGGGGGFGGGGGSGSGGSGGGGGFGGGGGGCTVDGGGGGGGGVGGGGGGCAGFGGGAGGGGGFGGGGGGGQGSGGGSGSGGGGGFGGGGGGSNSTAGGSGGLGGGAGGTNSGGGGLGAGGGIFNHQGRVTIVNSTLTQNIITRGPTGGDALGSGLFNFNGSVTLVNSSNFGNFGNIGRLNSDIYNLSFGNGNPTTLLTLQNSIVGELVNFQVNGSLVVEATAPNLVRTVQSAGATVNGSGISNADALLGPLLDNGGPTLTNEPLAGSPAVDAGDPAICTQPPVGGVDQRGVARLPASCSIGAYEQRQKGEACTADVACPSRFCVDGVCCDTACGNSDPVDCQACSRRAGAASDGTCSVLGVGTICRVSAGLCDVAELCSGSTVGCPADQLVPAQQVCHAATGLFDPEQLCSGTAPDCPLSGDVQISKSAGGGFGCAAAPGGARFADGLLASLGLFWLFSGARRRALARNGRTLGAQRAHKRSSAQRRS